MKKWTPTIVLITLFAPLSLKCARASILGEENIALAKLIIGQIVELERLAEIVEASQENIQVLRKVSEGIERSIRQVEGLESLIDRFKSVDPSSVRDLASLNHQLLGLKQIAANAFEVVELKIELAEGTVAQASNQSLATYDTGRELMQRGALFATEAKGASPHRASQLTASAQSAELMGQGAQLQAIAHLIQLQAQTLELVKLQTQTMLQASHASGSVFAQTLLARAKRPPRSSTDTLTRPRRNP